VQIKVTVLFWRALMPYSRCWNHAWKRSFFNVTLMGIARHFPSLIVSLTDWSCSPQWMWTFKSRWAKRTELFIISWGLKLQFSWASTSSAWNSFFLCCTLLWPL
jgi:hypothetical protein